MKELKIMSPGMLPNLSNLSAAAVKSRNLFLKSKQNRLKLSISIGTQRNNKKQK